MLAREAGGRRRPGRGSSRSRERWKTAAMETQSFGLTDTQKEFRAAVRQLAEARIAPHAAAVDRDAAYPWDGFKACVDMELPTLGIPTEYGGAGGDAAH